MILSNGQHLTYCSNIHAGETWEEVFNALKENIPPIKKRLADNIPFGIGLRLSNTASETLIQQKALDEFKHWLAVSQCYVFTMNGFPYGDFHGKSVKSNVHKPDWTTTDRVTYTKRLADILIQLLGDNEEGSISTSPLSYKPWLDNSESVEEAFKNSTENIIEVILYLKELHEKTSKFIHLDLEPEPDGLIENSKEFIHFFKEILIPALDSKLSNHAEANLFTAQEYFRVCYDVCHFAIEYEDHANAILAFRKEGIKIGKLQISAALKVILTQEEKDRTRLGMQLSSFEESTYLHQVVQKNHNGSYISFSDLALALPTIHHPDALEWRVHFHVPIYKPTYHALQSTQSDIIEVLNRNKLGKITNHMEVETYTWHVLPKEERLPLQDSIVRELEWVIHQINTN